MGQTFVGMYLFLNFNQLPAAKKKRIKKRCIPKNVWPFLFQQSFRTDFWAKIYFIWLVTCTRMVILSHTCTIEWGVTYSFLYEHFPLNRSYRIWVGLSSIQSCTANFSLILATKVQKISESNYGVLNSFKKRMKKKLSSCFLNTFFWKKWGHHKLLAR